MSSTIITPKNRQSYAILAGWLGCTPKSLRRYKDMYDRSNWEVVEITAPLSSVVGASYPVSSDDILLMREWAERLLRDMKERPCSRFVFHSFSNGGCLLWEQFRRFLTLDANEEMREKLVGVIFDSCPCRYDGGDVGQIRRAARFGPLSDRVKLFLRYGWIAECLRPSRQRDRALLRSQEFWDGMRNDPWAVPQLYIYSEDDDLTPTGPLKDLVTYREELFGRDLIWSLCFERSGHCRHLLKHSREYCSTIEAFLDRFGGLRGDDAKAMNSLL